MNKDSMHLSFNISEPSSGGIILSYQCSNECRHCLYSCAPGYRDWISVQDVDLILENLARHRRFLTGLHFAGGEPFLNPDILEYAIHKALSLNLPIDYVETNGFWGHSTDHAASTLQRLKKAGLGALLISCSPFHQEFISYETISRSVALARQIFGFSDVLIYTEFFYRQLSMMDPEYPLPLENYLEAIGEEQAAATFATEYSLIPNGRAATQLKFLYQRRPAASFFGETCQRELSNPYHIHIDLYGNYIAGLCAGISLGDGRNLDELIQGIDLEKNVMIRMLVQGGVKALYQWAKEVHGYHENPEGYIAKCHLCLDIRRHIVSLGHEYCELAPKEFYMHLET